MQKGFTLFELIVVLWIIAICAIMFAFVSTNFLDGKNSISWGISGAVETRCIGGVKVLIGPNGWVQQMLDEDGKAIKC